MQCDQARQLFDAYLDGELSSSLATELGAHRVRCPDCRQALALMEVSGHILRSDRDAVQAPDDFTDRLLACVDPAPLWRRKLLKSLYFGGPLAAAAVIALAFVGVFDRRNPSQVAGVQQIIAQPHVATSPKIVEPSAASAPIDPAQQALNDFFDRSQQQVQEQGESVQRVFDLTILQMLDILEDAKNRSQAESRRPSFQPPYGPLPEQAESEGVDESISNEQDGVVLMGSEVKSLRDKNASIEEAYVRLDDGELWLVGAHINPYAFANTQNHDPVRRRKLLVHKSELRKLKPKVEQKGLTLVPLRIFFNARGLAKVTVALARGKTMGDKRESLKKREHKREMSRAIRRSR